MDAMSWIERFSLQPHPEGGWYRELHRSDRMVQRQSDDAQRSGLTVIVFLLQAGQRSRWHRVQGSDEVWHHVAGAPLALLRLPPHGKRAEDLLLGPHRAEEPQQSPLHVVPADWWQAASSRGSWSLMHCMVSPGFAFDDFSLMADLPREQHPAGADPAFL